MQNVEFNFVELHAPGYLDLFLGTSGETEFGIEFD